MAIATHREVQAVIDVNQNILTNAVVDAHLPTDLDIKIKDFGYNPISVGPETLPKTKKLKRRENWWDCLALIYQMIFWGDA